MELHAEITERYIFLLDNAGVEDIANCIGAAESRCAASLSHTPLSIHLLLLLDRQSLVPVTGRTCAVSMQP